MNFSKLLWKWFDEGFIDAIVNGTATVVRRCGSVLRELETGMVKDYALSIVVGVVVVIGYLVLR